MGSSYERVALNDPEENSVPRPDITVPNSPPPSFRSRDSSLRPSRNDTRRSQEDRDLNDAFDAPSDDESEDGEAHDQRRLLQQRPATSRLNSSDEAEDVSPRSAESQGNATAIPDSTPSTPSSRPMGGGSHVNDGVWANISAKPRAGDDLEEKPPTYEQAAADATPPYWETTVFSPYASTGNPDDVFVDGLLVGSLFSFVWNALISMSFQLIGFLLTYLLHTTHAAKNGSRAGLGITLINYGFQMRYAVTRPVGDINAPTGPVEGVPKNPNNHDFDPNKVGNDNGDASASVTTADIISYILMIVGWFILIRSVSDFMRARRQEQLVRSSPDRGLGVAVVATGESAESSV